MSTGPEGPTAQPAAGPRHCYRHTDRETYISCQRCLRPICPDCMNQASVGFHCPECVAEGRRSVRQARTMAGGLVPDKVGPLSVGLIVINVVVFAAGFLDRGLGGDILGYGAMLGSDLALGRQFSNVGPGVAEGGYWRLLSAAFIHANLLHILFNMYALYLFGPMLEQVMGRLRFVAFYLTSAVAASVFVYVFSSPYTETVGASGAIFAMFGAALIVVVRRGQDPSQLLVLLAINGAITFLVPQISWQGHLGGLLAGLILGAALFYAPARARVPVQVLAFVGMWVLVLVTVVVRSQSLSGLLG